MADTLHIVTAIINPMRWGSRLRLAHAALENWLQEPNVHITLVEVAHGSRDYDLSGLGENDRITHVPLRATTLAWSKENCLNRGIEHLPHDAKYVGTFDADIHFRRPGWATETMEALDLYPVIQPWKTAYDLGPKGEHLYAHSSFASCYHRDSPVVPYGDNPAGLAFWVFNGGPYDYPHSGFAWAWTRPILDQLGGLFELGGTGAGDHHMALALAGFADYSLPKEIDGPYRTAVKTWEALATKYVNRKIGFLPHTIEHFWHGDKTRRAYQSRVDMFIKYQFNPYTDLKRNSYGVLEFAGNKPNLERLFDRYLRDRDEDSNTMG